MGASGIEELLAAYARTPVEFRRVTAGMRDGDALAAPAPGEWSVAQIVTHVWTLDGRTLVTFAGAERPPEAIMNPKNPPAFAPRLDAFELRRAAVVAAFRDLPADLWDTAITSRTKQYTPRQLLARFVRHDATHLNQIVATRRAVEEKQ